MKAGPSSRMNPARHTSTTPRDLSASASARSYAARSGYALCGITSVSIPAARARSSPAASARLEITTAMRASSRPAPMASMIAWRLLPRPEIRTPMLDILDGAVAFDDAADHDAAGASAGLQNRDHFGSRSRIARDDQPNSHVEGAQHLVV